MYVCVYVRARMHIRYNLKTLSGLLSGCFGKFSAIALLIARCFSYICISSKNPLILCILTNGLLCEPEY